MGTIEESTVGSPVGLKEGICVKENEGSEEGVPVGSRD